MTSDNPLESAELLFVSHIQEPESEDTTWRRALPIKLLAVGLYVNISAP